MGYFYRKTGDPALDKLYELLEDVTPLPFDCGELCGGACCKGGDADGMLLFPGERALFEGKDGFTVVRDGRYGCDAVVCSGSCDRPERPLSCRIYPYFFYVSREGKVTVAHDVRALERCPLAKEGARTDKTFLRRMRMAAKVIAADPALKAFVARLGEAMTDFGALA